MSKIEIGSTIKIKEELHNHLEEIKNQINTYKTMMKSGAAGKNHETNTLWKLISEHYPETNGCRMSLKYETNEILIVGKDHGNK